MRLKSFYAKTMTEAMQLVRENMGEEAIIVATQEEGRGKGVSVTAAIESDSFSDHVDTSSSNPEFELGRSGEPANANDWLQYDDEDEENAVYEKITEILLKHSCTEDVNDQILSCAMVMGLEQPHIAMLGAVEHLFGYAPLPTGKTKKPIMMIGSPGSGKTLAVAKIAAKGVMNDLNISVISTDTVRAGGIEQLEAFTKILNIDLKKAKTPKEFEKAIKDSAGSDQIIIDTAGTNPFDKKNLRNLLSFIEAGNVEPVLVMQAGIDANESAETARIFSSIGVKRMLVTKLDITRRLGGLLSAALHGNLAFCDASNTQRVADGLLELNPKTLTHMLMPEDNLNIRQTVKNNAK